MMELNLLDAEYVGAAKPKVERGSSWWKWALGLGVAVGAGYIGLRIRDAQWENAVHWAWIASEYRLKGTTISKAEAIRRANLNVDLSNAEAGLLRRTMLTYKTGLLRAAGHTSSGED